MPKGTDRLVNSVERFADNHNKRFNRLYGQQALQCAMCKGSGKVQYQLKKYTMKSGEKATAECISDAIAENRSELVHFPPA